jgi:hypothetical protein
LYGAVGLQSLHRQGYWPLISISVVLPKSRSARIRQMP